MRTLPGVNYLFRWGGWAGGVLPPGGGLGRAKNSPRGGEIPQVPKQTSGSRAAALPASPTSLSAAPQHLLLAAVALADSFGPRFWQWCGPLVVELSPEASWNNNTLLWLSFYSSAKRKK